MATTFGPGSTSSKLTAPAVIEMFADLGLVVCDDEASIRAKVLQQRDRRLKDKRSTDGQTRVKADAWWENADSLQTANRRAALLEIVYAQFRDLADAAISAALASGNTKLTDSVKENLRKISLTSCRTDAALADRFLSTYLAERQLTEDLATPDPVTAFTAKSGMGHIELVWTLPPSHCDRVEIVRDSVSHGGDRERIYEGAGTSHVDRDGLIPGIRYTYQIRSIYQGVASSPTTDSAISVADVNHAEAALLDGALNLSWEPPAPGVPAVVLRKAGAPPTVRPGKDCPEAADDATLVVRRGALSSFVDMDVEEGRTYHYLIVSDFGQGICGSGVRLQIAVPRCPPPVQSVTASFRSRLDGKNEVGVSWPKAPTSEPVKYMVIRRSSNVPAVQPEEGVLVDQLAHLDSDVLPGHRYTYTVFAKSGDLFSRSGTASPPVDILSEVTGVRARTGDSCVELEWEPPPGVLDVCVRRSLNPPSGPSDGIAVTLTGPKNARDEGLRDERQVHYLVCCKYRPDGKNEVFSPGVRVSALPVRMPDPVLDFALEIVAGEVRMSWTPPEHGQVVILRSAGPPAMPVGYRTQADRLDDLGERVASGARGRATDSEPNVGAPYYSVFTVAGAHIVFGGFVVGAVTPDVSDLRFDTGQDGIILRWRWPDRHEVKEVVVARRHGSWPIGPHDPEAVLIHCTRHEYEEAGEKLLVRGQEEARYFFTVFAQATAFSGQWCAAGTAEGCRGVVEWAPRMTLRYCLAPGNGPKGDKFRLRWKLEQPFSDLAGFVLRASGVGIPEPRESSVTLFTWKPEKGSQAGCYEAWISSDAVRNWPHFYYKLFLIDPAQNVNTLVIHPDVSVPVSLAAEPAGGAATPPTTFRPGVPRKLVCPRCFLEFPLEEMTFNSFSGGETLPARYSWWERLLGQPLRIPKNSRGQRLTRKLCPDGHDLPYTAGNQSNVVIGIIGGKYSGKSSYIASLIERLQGRVCGDFEAALLHVSEEGQRRYESEFFKPQFVNKQEVPLTSGTPAPLIYELTIDGRVFGEKRNRSVTLALYDTAGENLTDPDAVRQMVQYLKVASGVMFLIDPLQVDSVRDRMPESVKLPPKHLATRPENVISNVMKELSEKGDYGDRLTIPVAVVLTKCDVLRDAGLIEGNRLWCQETRHVGYYDQEIHDDTAGMMADYVKHWSDTAMNIVRQKFSKYAFFGVSATGCASEKGSDKYPFVAPWRVEDPLLWLLAELGILRSRRIEW